MKSSDYGAREILIDRVQSDVMIAARSSIWRVKAGNVLFVLSRGSSTAFEKASCGFSKNQALLRSVP